MKKDMETKYNPKVVEDRLYADWVEKGYFHAEADENKEPYTIMIPPPNITGRLHMGHALNATLQDVLIRFKKLQGYNALWMPGTDHAAIATEVKIVEKMAEEGLTKASLGRDAFMKRAWQWYDDVGGVITKQFRKLGVACDWQRQRFTMDKGCSDAVLEVFVKLHEKGLIYRGERLVNWCTQCKTSISDAEVEHEDKQSGFWHFKYPIKDSDEYVVFATTRPETMLGDVAIAVNPSDERYAHLVGKTAIMPILGRELKIVADEYVKADFGTGMVKVTPAHDFNDFEIGVRHDLERINIMNDDGSINEAGGDNYAGLDRYEARKKIIAQMDDMGYFVRKEEITNAVGGHDRCGSVVEPLNKLQWFVKMEELARPALDAYKNGDLNIVPPRFGKVYSHWLEGIKDWCISRQLWWGHRIPAYHCEGCEHIEVAKIAPDKCPKCGGAVYQDEDSLDTWFSSALWPFSTLGWPEKTPELAHFYPTSVLVTAYEILFFWVIRMAFAGIEFMGELPFKDVLLHGVMRDDQGRKMSKSLGNGIDPLGIIEEYGADALRFSLATGNSPGNDLRFYIEKVESSRNFLNKIWNASRFIMMNLDNETAEATFGCLPSELTAADKWIISKANTLAKEVAENLDKYELGLAADKAYSFMWDEFCDWYIEMAKPRLYNADDETRLAALWTLQHILSTGLRLLHPFIPFITEEIYTSFGFGESILLADYPKYQDELNFPIEEGQMEQIKEAVRALRNMRSQMNVPPSRKAQTFVVSTNVDVRAVFEAGAKYIKSLAGANEVIVLSEKVGIDDNAVSVVVPSAEIFMPLAELVDMEKERERLQKEIKKLQGEVDRVNAKLNNQGFIAKAPANLVEEEKAKAAKYQEMLQVVQKQLEGLK
ncbi:MAG: valine--tRNA ligase [Defluviitaleaceae bacterium]|nr:valine--tRNA ligase [Defluviitaleaceae bacterium]